jgi:restriction system protein
MFIIAMVLLMLGVDNMTAVLIPLVGVPVVLGTMGLVAAYRERKRQVAADEHFRQLEEERRQVEEEERRQREEEQRRREEQQRKLIESLLHRDAVRDEINYMTGAEFEKFIAGVFRQKGYEVEETPGSGDQGVDLIVPDLDGKRVVIQLKRWTGPVGNKAVQATFSGMAHYQANEGWIITTSTFTKSARELARSTRVRLIDGKELADWLEGLREEDAPESSPDPNGGKEARRRRRRR